MYNIFLPFRANITSGCLFIQPLYQTPGFKPVLVGEVFNLFVEIRVAKQNLINSGCGERKQYLITMLFLSQSITVVKRIIIPE